MRILKTSIYTIKDGYEIGKENVKRFLYTRKNGLELFDYCSPQTNSCTHL